MTQRSNEADEQARRDRETIRLVDAAITDGKIIPAQRKWALGYALKDEPGFNTFIQLTPPRHKPAEQGPPGGDATLVELTEAEKGVCVKLGIKPDLYLAEKTAAREVAVGQKISLAEWNNDKAYPYLEKGDAAFCRAFRLSEDDFLSFFGGLLPYRLFCLNRDATRKDFVPPTLPVEITPDTVRALAALGVSFDEKALAKTTVSELQEWVVQALRTQKQLRSMERGLEDDRKAKERDEQSNREFERDHIRRSRGLPPGSIISDSDVDAAIAQMKRARGQ